MNHIPQKLTPRAWWLIPCRQHGPSDHCFALAQGHVDASLCSCRHRRDPDCRVHFTTSICYERSIHSHTDKEN